jgi:hypothetical protein
VSLHVTQNPVSLSALADDREPLSLQSDSKRITEISINNAKMFSGFNLPLPHKLLFKPSQHFPN